MLRASSLGLRCNCYTSTTFACQRRSRVAGVFKALRRWESKLAVQELTRHAGQYRMHDPREQDMQQSQADDADSGSESAKQVMQRARREDMSPASAKLQNVATPDVKSRRLHPTLVHPLLPRRSYLRLKRPGRLELMRKQAEDDSQADPDIVFSNLEATVRSFYQEPHIPNPPRWPLTQAEAGSQNGPKHVSRRPYPAAADAANSLMNAEYVEVGKRCLDTLATTESVSDGWKAYDTLMSLPRDESRIPVPFQYLHRLARLIISTPRPTRSLFMRLLSVISTIHKTGGQVRLWQWNALIDFGGRGWRKTRQEDFRTALDVFGDLVSHKAPGKTFSKTEPGPNVSDEHLERYGHLDPDIVTYTTLLNIAGRTLHEPTVRHAHSILISSGIPPNRITHLTLLRYFTRRGELYGVRATVMKMRQQGFYLGLHGINSCLWAYARNGRLDIASAIYRVLRHRVSPDDVDAIREDQAYLADSEGIEVPDDIVPDQLTYTALIQGYSYRGELVHALTVFMDMVSWARNTLPPASEGAVDDAPHVPASVLVPGYRAIFLGFARHGKPPRVFPEDAVFSQHLWSLKDEEPSSPTHIEESRAGPGRWNLKTLDMLFTEFMTLPLDSMNERIIYWILVGYAKTSGYNTQRLREVYTVLEAKFRGRWGGRLARLKERIFSEKTDSKD